MKGRLGISQDNLKATFFVVPFCGYYDYMKPTVNYQKSLKPSQLMQVPACLMDQMQQGFIYELFSIIIDKSHMTRIFSFPKIIFDKLSKCLVTLSFSTILLSSFVQDFIFMCSSLVRNKKPIFFPHSSKFLERIFFSPSRFQNTPPPLIFLDQMVFYISFFK